MEIRSNYINVPLLAELIERKSQLWARAFPTPSDMISHPDTRLPIPNHCLQQEVHSIIESLRLIFRNRAEFIELTLLRVKPYPASINLLGPVFEAFLGTTAATPCSATPITPTGLTIYRSNDVETYGRLMLCYAKWKSLFWTMAEMNDPNEWAGIDAVALTQLPYDFPRAICPRDALLRRIFPIVAVQCRIDSATGVAPTGGKRNNATTRTLLRTLPKRPDLQELCLKFTQAYRCGSDATPPAMQDLQDQQEAHPQTTNSTAYKSMSASAERSHRWHLSGAVSGQPTLQPHEHTKWRSEMKPIIIPDSDDADETSPSDAISMLVKESVHNIPAHDMLHPDPSTPRSNDVFCPTVVSTGNDTCSTSGMDRHSSTTPPDEFVTDSATTLVPVWSPFAECFLNTPPATPQHENPPEVVDEEQRRVVLVKKSFPSTSWARLKGTIRLIGQRKKRISAAGIGKRVLGKIFAHGGWWNFSDILAVKLHTSTKASRGSSIVNEGLTGNCILEVKDTLTNDRLKLLSPQPAIPTVDCRSSTGKADGDRAKNDALLRELIDCLGTVDTMPLDSKQGYVDFAILPDNPGYGTERSLTDTVDDQASPPVCGTCVDTSPLFAADSDKYVLLFTELGPVSWPIV